MRTIDVCLTPDLMHLYRVEDRSVVVVDILRATSCMTTALAHGVSKIFPVAGLEEALSLKSSDVYTAGERDGKKVEGFDFGNSPFEYMQPELKGKSLAFTTTNGTQAIVKSLGAREIIVGSFLNVSTVAKHLAASSNNVLVVCAGWKGKFNLEDTLFAGALVEQLTGILKPECDSALAAAHLYDRSKSDMVTFLSNSSHVQRLARLGISKDIEFCVTHDTYTSLPVLRDGALVDANR